MNAPLDFQTIRARLIDDIEAIARELAPGGRRAGKYWIAKNPTRLDHHAGSFWILLEGPAAGAWRDEAGLRGVDEGDVVRLVQYCRRLPDMKETRKECLKILGVAAEGGRPLSRAEVEASNKARAERLARQEEAERRTRAKKARGAFGLWLKAAELSPAGFPGSIVDRYLKSRSIDLVAGLIERGRALPGALRFLADHDYHTLDGEVLAFPCLIALMSGPDGKPRAVHRTWLEPDGSDKARLPDPDENKPRKIWPAGWSGAVIRIAKGAGDRSPEEAARRGRPAPLVVTEGVEDALSVALALPDRRVWAAGTLGNIENVPVGHACVSRVTVCADNDWGAQARAQLDRAIGVLRAAGKPVSVARSPRGKDMNDLLKGETT